MEIRQTVYQKSEQRFNMVGQALPQTLHETNQAIGKTRAELLAKYAKNRLIENGFNVDGWTCEVWTMDHERRVDDRIYTVDFINEKGGKIGIEGIHINNGKPVLDYGIFASQK